MKRFEKLRPRATTTGPTRARTWKKAPAKLALMPTTEPACRPGAHAASGRLRGSGPHSPATSRRRKTIAPIASEGTP
jgi:hypothetical protein